LRIDASIVGNLAPSIQATSEFIGEFYFYDSADELIPVSFIDDIWCTWHYTVNGRNETIYFAPIDFINNNRGVSSHIIIPGSAYNVRIIVNARYNGRTYIQYAFFE
jgi:hypothetical protein